MLTKIRQAAASGKHAHHIAFFQQSGWMMMTATASGFIMYAVHPVISRNVPAAEYGVFTTLLQIVSLMGIPAMGLQPVIAAQAAAAVTEKQQQIVASEFRGVARAIFFMWLAMAVLAGIFWHQAIAGLKIQNPVAFGVTVVIGLAAMWMPLTMGILQGRQNFFWLGWSNVLNGIGRFGLICILVLVFHAWAAGAMSAVLAGMAAVIGVCTWQVADLWKIKTVPVAWKDWLRRVIPLTLGLGAAQFMLSADMIFTQNCFPRGETGFYAAAGMIGRALVFFTQPLTLVMFPKLARSAATGEKSHALALALGMTVLAGAGAALRCTLFPSLPLRLALFKPNYIQVAAPLVPWFAWCMLPLTLSTVLVNSLMAKSKFSAVPWLVLVAVAYGIALSWVGHRAARLEDSEAGLCRMIQTLGVFNTIMFGVCAFFTWAKFPKR
ncbi:MAG TPA: oligosaccharide flippase family protein [Verrucomicrobiae bacterium]|nr:oligosaccharide flippase family protein [Verrucomicrobiae bacterium]